MDESECAKRALPTRYVKIFPNLVRGLRFFTKTLIICLRRDPSVQQNRSFRQEGEAMASSQSTEARATSHLLFELTIEILSRLPVKSLLRFKSVCKTWYALIKTPNFIAQHAITQSTLDSTSLLVTTYNRETENFAMSLVNDGFSNGPINLDFPILNRRICQPYCDKICSNFFKIVGICNGLVCINVYCSGYPLILCNPSTRQFREIPGAGWIWEGVPEVPYRSSIQWLFGFGFHPNANDYKLIRIVFYSTSLWEGHNIRADLYAMSSETWREIDVNKVSLFFSEIYDFGENDGSVQICGSSASAILNGVFYWPAVMGTHQVVVMSFDMGDEVFRKTRIPEGLDITWYDTNWQITQLYDKLALIVSPDRTGFNVWVLNENESSWTMQVNLESFPRIANNMLSGEFGSIRVVVGGKNGELLATSHKLCGKNGELKLFVYDPKTQETKDLCFGQFPCDSSHVYSYAGTLLPVMQADKVGLD